eukprot:COSAG02_NODE_3264_length_7066_cov_91.385101_2_plen_54_part_00
MLRGGSVHTIRVAERNFRCHYGPLWYSITSNVPEIGEMRVHLKIGYATGSACR